MGTRATTPNSNAETAKGWYQGRLCKIIRQRVTITHGQSIIAVGVNVPAASRVIHAHLRNAGTNNAVSGAIGGTAPNAVALMMYPVSNAAATTVLTAAPSTASASNPAGTNGYMLAITPGTGTSETNGVFRGNPAMETMQTSVLGRNNNPTDAFLALVPAHTSSNRIQVNSAATDSGYYFGTTNAANTSSPGSADVVLYVEVYDDYPSF